MKRLARYLAVMMTAVTVGVMLSSCATIISGTKADIIIDGNVDEPVTITTSEAVYPDVSLPTMVKVKRRHLGGQHIRITSDSYAFNDIVLQRSINEWSLLDWFGSLVPLGIDLLTNAVSTPMQNSFFVTPVGHSSVADSIYKADSIHHAALEQARRAARTLPAKYRRHELSGGIGFGANQADHATSSMINSCMERYRLEYDGECFDIFGDSYLFANLEYHYRLNRKWDIGALAAWGLSRESFISSYSSEMPVNDGIGSEACRYFVAAPSVRFTWYESPSSRCYSRVALGLMRHHLSFHYSELQPDAERNQTDYSVTDRYSDIRWRMAWQATVVGGSVGTDAFRFFGELGYGCLGVVRMGLSIGF